MNGIDEKIVQESPQTLPMFLNALQPEKRTGDISTTDVSRVIVSKVAVCPGIPGRCRSLF